MELLHFGYNKVEKAFKVIVRYPTDGDTFLYSFNVKWKENDNEDIFLERIYRGAVFMFDTMKNLSGEGIVVKDMVILASEYKEEYKMILKVGNLEPRCTSYIYAKSSDTAERLVEKVQSIKSSFTRTRISDKRKDFAVNFKSFIGI